MTRILLTGATGAVGSVIARQLAEFGVDVIRAGRGDSQLHFDLKEQNLDLNLRHFDGLIHCAWDFSCKNSEIFAINGLGSARLLSLANEYKLPILFISTLAAHPNSLSRYGLTKFFLEQLTLEFGGCVARLGAYTSSQGMDLYSRLKTLNQRLLFSILPGNKKHKYYETTNTNLRELLVQYLESDLSITGKYLVATEKPKSLQEILDIKKPTIYLGLAFPYIVLRGLERLTRSGKNSDSLLSLKFQATSNEIASLIRL